MHVSGELLLDPSSLTAITLNAYSVRGCKSLMMYFLADRSISLTN